jgi:hypothetical protein
MAGNEMMVGQSQLLNSLQIDRPGRGAVPGMAAQGGEGQAQGQAGPLNGLLDGVDLSPRAQGMLTYTRAQFAVNVQSLRAISNSQGRQMEARSFRFEANFEFLQAAAGQEPLELEELDGESLVQTMQDLFSPEKTAGRILDFALSWYQPDAETGDTEEARQAFADTIGAAVQKGFDEAQAILGNLPEEVQAGIDETHERVFRGIEDFVVNGLPEDHAERSQAIREYAAQWQASVRMEYSYQHLETRTYRADGRTEQLAGAEQAVDAHV